MATSHALPSLLLVALTGACSSPTAPAPDVTVQTTEAAFTWSPGLVDISYTITNNGRAPAYVAACGENPWPDLDQLVEGAWVEGTGRVCSGIYSTEPISVAPGESAAFVAATIIPNPGDTYRLRLAVASSREGPFEGTRSNEFVVE